MIVSQAKGRSQTLAKCSQTIAKTLADPPPQMLAQCSQTPRYLLEQRVLEYWTTRLPEEHFGHGEALDAHHEQLVGLR